jgi:hypothetical protein
VKWLVEAKLEHWLAKVPGSNPMDSFFSMWLQQALAQVR